jgi:hypothetical protein
VLRNVRDYEERRRFTIGERVRQVLPPPICTSAHATKANELLAVSLSCQLENSGSGAPAGFRGCPDWLARRVMYDLRPMRRVSCRDRARLGGGDAFFPKFAGPGKKQP